MTTKTPQKNSRLNRPPSLLGSIVTEGISYIGLALLGWMIAVVIGIGYFFYEGADATSIVFANNISLQLNVLDQQTVQFVISAANYFLNSINHVQRWIATIPHVHTGISMVDSLLAMLVKTGVSVANVVLLITLTVALKLLVLFIFMHVLILFLLLGLVDGLVMREVRRYSNARESAMIYNQWRRLFKPILVTGYGIYLLYPYPIMPDRILLPTILIASFIVSLMVKTYKKYL